VIAVRAIWGLALLAQPRPFADRRVSACARLLGARHVAEAVVLAWRRRPTRWAYAIASIDGLHALSMLGLAAVDRRHRRIALTSAAIASCLAWGGVAAP
jgi:hypothetical protein